MGIKNKQGFRQENCRESCFLFILVIKKKDFSCIIAKGLGIISVLFA